MMRWLVVIDWIIFIKGSNYLRLFFMEFGIVEVSFISILVYSMVYYDFFRYNERFQRFQLGVMRIFGMIVNEGVFEMVNVRLE